MVLGAAAPSRGCTLFWCGWHPRSGCRNSRPPGSSAAATGAGRPSQALGLAPLGLQVRVAEDDLPARP